MSAPTHDRRRHVRVRFRSPLSGAVGDARVAVLDLSSSGVGIVHRAPLPPPGRICRVEMVSDFGPIKVDCAIIRTVKKNAEDAANAIFHTGLQVVAASDPQSYARLQTVLERR